MLPLRQAPKGASKRHIDPSDIDMAKRKEL